MGKEMTEGFKFFGIPESEEIKDRFKTYGDFLIEYNQKVNLTSITDPAEIEIKHFLDSVSCQRLIPKGARVIDVGTGAGFPGVPLKIVREDIGLTLMDSLRKRVDFLTELTGRLKLQADIFHMRAEDGGHEKSLRESFDVAVSRAVANLPLLCEYCLPFVKENGLFLALKGREAENEAKDAEKAVRILGGKIEKVENFFWGNLEHRVVVIRKICRTPPQYPRKAGKPSKNPII